jgi:hypothetical protein
MSRLALLSRKYTNDSKEMTTTQYGFKTWPKVSYANLGGMGLVRARSTIAFVLATRAALSGRAAGTESNKKEKAQKRRGLSAIEFERLREKGVPASALAGTIWHYRCSCKYVIDDVRLRLRWLDRVE